eukprot:Mycagemm_TRINITY_DN10270_c0_g3::TRINITY_DN10270_c0_g3_i1::g.3999::m.3999 type:complete len:115 gc:universal TRINITY_DN10270_c0_g3_i1:1017-673(-)
MITRRALEALAGLVLALADGAVHASIGLCGEALCELANGLDAERLLLHRLVEAQKHLVIVGRQIACEQLGDLLHREATRDIRISSKGSLNGSSHVLLLLAELHTPAAAGLHERH